MRSRCAVLQQGLMARCAMIVMRTDVLLPVAGKKVLFGAVGMTRGHRQVRVSQENV